MYDTYRIIKCKLASSQKLCHNYVIRLTNIFTACNSHEHHAISKTISELKDALQQIQTALLQKLIAKSVNDFFSQWRLICQLIEDILNMKCSY